jgi:hypothetical protein
VVVRPGDSRSLAFDFSRNDAMRVTLLHSP